MLFHFASYCSRFVFIFLPVIISHMRGWYEILQRQNISIAIFWYWSPPVDYFSRRGVHKVRICSLNVVVGCFLLVLDRFRLLLVASCCFLLFEGRFRSFQARCSSFQIVSGLFLLVVCRFRLSQVVFGRFFLVVARFKAFQVVSCLLWAVLDHFLIILVASGRLAFQ